jgi:tetratricopeptide (TPR) repeat protein
VFYLERADSLLRKGGSAERALADLDQAIKLKPGLAIAHSRRAVALTLTKAPGEPLAEAEEGVRLDPKSAEARVTRGMIGLAAAQRERAAADFDEAIRLDPKHAEAYEARGLLRRANGDLDGAVRDFGEAIRLDPGMVVPMCSAVAYFASVARTTRRSTTSRSRSATRPCRRASTSSVRKATRSSAGCRKRSTISASRAGSIRGCQPQAKAMRASRRRSRRAAGRSRREIPEFGAQSRIRPDIPAKSSLQARFVRVSAIAFTFRWYFPAISACWHRFHNLVKALSGPICVARADCEIGDSTRTADFDAQYWKRTRKQKGRRPGF